MPKSGQLIKFESIQKPASKKKQIRQNAIRNIDGVKYFNRQQIQLLRRTVRDQATVHSSRGNVTAIREWLAIDVLTATGLRVSELADLRCGDVLSGYGDSAIFVRHGKGSKSRTVQIPQSLKKHLKSFISWKRENSEPVGDDDFIFVGQRGPVSPQAIQQLVKKYLKQLNLYSPGKSVHSLRHSYAIEIYRTEKDLLAVKRQLGHSSLQSTQIYADVTSEDVQRQIKGLWVSPPIKN